MLSTDSYEAQNYLSRDSTTRIVQQDVIKHDLQIKALIQDIRECNSGIESLNALNAQVADQMRKMRTAIEELESLSVEINLESDRKQHLKDIENHHKQYASNQFALRRANLACQERIDKQNKEELFHRSVPAVRRRGRADQESIAKQSSAITDSLLSVSHMMAGQVKQSEEALHALISSSATVTDTKEEFTAMGSVLHHSKVLLQKYGRREVTDKVLMVLAVLFFLTCVFYIVHKRLF